MPCFDFECSECDHFIEDYYLTTTEVPPTTCPACGKETLKKLFPNNVQVRVKLEGHDLKQHLLDENKKIRREISKDGTKAEALRANLAGEENFHKKELAVAKAGEELRQRIK
jgi:putative FmdB family regulatory protein